MSDVIMNFSGRKYEAGCVGQAVQEVEVFNGPFNWQCAVINGQYSVAVCRECGRTDVEFRHTHCRHCGGLVPLIYAPNTGEGRLAVMTEVARIHSDPAYRTLLCGGDDAVKPDMVVYG